MGWEVNGEEFGLGLIGADVLDNRDYLKRVKMGFSGKPKPIDLSERFKIEIDHQRDNSCTGRSARKLAEVCFQKTTLDHTMRFSALGYYYEARSDVRRDQGAQLRALAMAMVDKGGVPEAAWRPNMDPTIVPEDYQNWNHRRTYKLPSMERVLDAKTLMKTLSVEKVPVITGIAIQDRATQKMLDTGWCPPYDPDDPVIGYHAEVAVAWDIVRGKTWIKWAGSWGTHVGMAGFYWRPLEYIQDRVVVDMWTVGSDFL